MYYLFTTDPLVHFVVGWESKAISPIEIVAIFFAENAICSKGSPDNETTTALAFERMHVGHKHGETGRSPSCLSWRLLQGEHQGLAILGSCSSKTPGTSIRGKKNATHRYITLTDKGGASSKMS